MAFTTLTDLKTKVDTRLAQESNSALILSSDELDSAVRDGLDLFNDMKPRKRTFEQAGDGTTKRVVLTDTVTDWIDQTSAVKAVHRVTDPNTDDESIQTYVRGAWHVQQDVSDKDVLLIAEAVADGTTLRIEWNTPHTVEGLDSETVTTVPEKFHHALILLCVSYGANLVASKAADMANLSLGADMTDFQDIQRRWLDIGTRRKKQAMDVIGRGGASSAVEWESVSKLSRQGRVSH